jgi:hypothetical protein
MKKLLALSAVTLAVALLVTVPVAFSQERPSAEKTFDGQLTKVDAAAKSISVKGADNKEMMFHYTDQTQVIGEQSIQGLTGKAGAQLKISYQEQGKNNIATKIEVVQQK